MIYNPENPSQIERPKGLQWVTLLWRLATIALVMFGFLIPVIVARLLSAHDTAQAMVKLVCRAVLRIIGLRFNVEGTALLGAGFIAANHTSWLDIFVLNACAKIYFVAKSEVETWPMIGIFARAVGTVFITRKRQEAGRQKHLLDQHLRAGHRLLFFPEGTSSDGMRVLPFKSTLFAAAFEAGSAVQALSVRYHSPDGKRTDFYGWYGDMGFAESFFEVLATRRNGTLDLIFYPPVSPEKFKDRKALAEFLEDQVRDGFNRSKRAKAD